MMQRKQTAEKYIKKTKKRTSMTVRLSPLLKKQSEEWANKLGTSLNRFSEAALQCYADQLHAEKEKRNPIR